MSSQAITFISFRRVRYHEASLAYRDLMFSGAVPWLSDHCIDAERALKLKDAPDHLGALLSDRIANCDCALVLADDGYFTSAWTRLELEHLIASKVFTIIVLLDDARIPAELISRIRSTTQIYHEVDAALSALCQQLGTRLVPFCGRRLFFSRPASTYGVQFEIPDFLSDPGRSRLHFASSDDRQLTGSENHVGDFVHFRLDPIHSGPASRIIGLLRAESDVGDQRLYDLYDQELWYHVSRVHSQCGPGHRLIGYHKFRVPGLNVTAVGLSLCANNSGGFFRYASLPLVSTGSRLQIVCFVRGSLQRFHTLVPEIDSMLFTMGGGLAPIGKPWHLAMLPGLGPYVAQDFVWMRCVRCHHRLSLLSLTNGCCDHCGFRSGECVTVTCPNRKRMTIEELANCVETECRVPIQVQARAIGSESANALCEGCSSSLYIPGNFVTHIDGAPDRSFPVVLHPRFCLLVPWCALCAIGLIWNGGSMYRWALCLLGGFLSFEWMDLSPRDPAGWRGYILHCVRGMALACCLLWSAANVSLVNIASLPPWSREILASRGLLALAGEFVLAGVVAYAAMTSIRGRAFHLRLAAVYAAVYALVVMWFVSTTDEIGKTASAMLLILPGAMAVVAVTMIDTSRIAPPEVELLWDGSPVCGKGAQT